MKRFTSVEEYLESQEAWTPLLTAVRDTMLDCGLEEAIKWGAPAYLSGGKTIIGLAAFKSHMAVWFHQGALLKDSAGVLINAQEGKTQALRQWRIQSEAELDLKLLRAYIEEAIENQKQGKAIKPQKKPLIVPDELQTWLDNNPEGKARFEGLGLSRKREYTDYISEAKRAETKQKRLEKIGPMILQGIGLHDKYRS
ncbi:YdeI/OmpD-associated family protein [bacterium SCSIO 12741]|nr:YdeI/OmpD-associated family protein [bacterium SCSIO 12741]